MSDPAIALIEFDSISAGIVAGDAMVKSSPVGEIYAGTVHPGKYLVLVTGDTASVEVALDAGSEAGDGHITDHVFLPDVHPGVIDALVHGSKLGGEALGVVETSTAAAVLDAADAGVKAAEVILSTLRLADGLGGKGYLIMSGTVGEVEASVDAAAIRAGDHGALVRSDVIAQLHEEMAQNLDAEPLFRKQIGA